MKLLWIKGNIKYCFCNSKKNKYKIQRPSGRQGKYDAQNRKGSKGIWLLLLEKIVLAWMDTKCQEKACGDERDADYHLGCSSPSHPDAAVPRPVLHVSSQHQAQLIHDPITVTKKLNIKGKVRQRFPVISNIYIEDKSFII